MGVPSLRSSITRDPARDNMSENVNCQVGSVISIPKNESTFTDSSKKFIISWILNLFLLNNCRKFQQNHSSDGLRCLEEMEDGVDIDSEYSGEVSSWRSREDSLDILTSYNNSLDILEPEYISDINSAPIIRPDVRRWTTDKLCR